MAADVVFGSVGVERDFWPVEHHQQLGLVGMKTSEQPIEGGKAGLSLEDAVKSGAQGGPSCRRRIAAVGLQIGVEPPDQAAHPLLGSAMVVGEGIELVDQPLGMDPAQSMAANLELSGIVADNHSVLDQAMRLDAAPQRAFGCNQRGIRRDLEC